MKVNILFTSIGRRVELINSWKKAYADLGISGQIIGTDIDPLAAAANFVDSFHIVPKSNHKNFISSIQDICNEKDINLVFPLNDHDLGPLSVGKSLLEQNGRIVVVCNKQTIKISTDKLKTYEFFKDSGISTPKTWKPNEKNESDFPLLIKPRYGSASQNVFKVNNQDELKFYIPRIEDPIIQQFINGPEITTDVICDFKGSIVGIVNRERLEVRWGEVAKGKTIFDNNVINNCKNIAENLDIVGPITVQCILKDNDAYFIEINARYGGGAPLGIAAGVKSPHWYLSIASGIELDLPQIGSFKKNLYLSRYDNSIFIDEEKIKSNTV